MIRLEKELQYEKNKSIAYFTQKMKSKEIVVAKALRFDSKNRVVICKLSDKVSAELPVSEVVTNELKALYNSNANTYFYPEIISIIGSNISVIITSYNSNSSTFIISRRDALIKIFNKIKSEEYLYCAIKSMTDTCLFLDCGGGVPGLMYIGEATECKIRQLKDSFNENDIIKCKIIGSDEENYRIFLSRKQAIESENIILHENDIVYGKVRESFSAPDDSFGQKSFFFEIFPYNIVGILNTFFFDGELRYNDPLICCISKINHGERYKLKVIKRL